MKRIPEPEIMDGADQANAYASADFNESNSLFVNLFSEKYGQPLRSEKILDLGCGPGDIMFRLSEKSDSLTLHGLDGSGEMLAIAEKINKGKYQNHNIQFIEGIIPGTELPSKKYDVIISNSLLHHLHEPQHFWNEIIQFSDPGTFVFVMDLFRPVSIDDAKRIVETYSANEPDVLKTDFYNSLLAAFESIEIKQQLELAGIKGFQVETVSDRHQIVWGTL
jgi:ubiquinone/menaquinone biosynthesis C-methylase UbiE